LLIGALLYEKFGRKGLPEKQRKGSGAVREKNGGALEGAKPANSQGILENDKKTQKK